MRRKLYPIFAAFIFLAFIFPGAGAKAQNDAAVQVDLSVLGIKDSSSPTPDPLPALNMQRAERPSLIGPGVRRAAPSPQVISSPPAEDVPKTIRGTRSTEPKRQVISFPVQVRERTEQYDPSLRATPIYDGPGEQPEEEAVVSPPLPAFKPVAIAARKVEKVSKPPVPAHRPTVVRTDAEVFTRKSGQDQMIALNKGKQDMPARLSGKVMAETLRPDKEPPFEFDDDLGGQLVTPGREQMVQSVEEIAALAEKIHSAAQNRKSAAAANIEPAAGTASAAVAKSMVPRKPPEGDHEERYISVSFEPGMAELDARTAESLESEVIPLLQSHPGWRLQIQSFAGKEGDDDKSSRRTSLARALAVRTHLLERGIEAQRMDVRALGMQTDRNPVDRIDFVFFDPAT